MILRTYDDDPLSLPPLLYFAMYNRVAYVQRILCNGTFTPEQQAMLELDDELEEDWSGPVVFPK